MKDELCWAFDLAIKTAAKGKARVLAGLGIMFGLVFQDFKRLHTRSHGAAQQRQRVHDSGLLAFFRLTHVSYNYQTMAFGYGKAGEKPRDFHLRLEIALGA
jgi:hypothetical protein